MKIIDILKDTRTISCEFFPPRTEDGISGVFGAIQRLQRFSPDFISVTYGAGGSTRAFTERITVEAKDLGDMEVMAHLTCVGQTREEVHGVLGAAAFSRDRQRHCACGATLPGASPTSSRLKAASSTQPS